MKDKKTRNTMIRMAIAIAVSIFITGLISSRISRLLSAPVTEVVTELSNKGQEASNQAKEIVADQTIYDFMREIQTVFTRPPRLFVVIFAWCVSLACSELVDRILCTKALRKWLTEGLQNLCDEEESNNNIGETLLIGVLKVFCVSVIIYEELSPFL